MSGYTHYACRDCFEIAISGCDDKPNKTLCLECEKCMCDETGEIDCDVGRWEETE